MDKQKLLEIEASLKKYHVAKEVSPLNTSSPLDVSSLLEEFRKIEEALRAKETITPKSISEDKIEEVAVSNWGDTSAINEYNTWFNGWSQSETIKEKKEDLWAAEDKDLILAAIAFGFEIGDNFVYKANGKECLGTIVGWNFDTPIVWIQDDPEDMGKETDPALAKYIHSDYRVFSKDNYYTYFDRELISTMTEHDKEAFLIRTKKPILDKTEQEKNLEKKNIVFGGSVFFAYQDCYLRGRVLKDLTSNDKVAIKIEEVIHAPAKSILKSGNVVEQHISDLTAQSEANILWRENNKLGLCVGDYATVKASPYTSKYRLLGTYKVKDQTYLYVSNQDGELRSGILPEALTRLTSQQVRDFRGIKQLKSIGLYPDQKVKVYLGDGKFKNAIITSYDLDRKEVIVKNISRNDKEKYHKVWDIFPQDTIDRATRAAEIRGFYVQDLVLISEKDEKPWKIVSFFHEGGEDKAIVYDESYNSIVQIPLHKLTIAKKEETKTPEKIRRPIVELKFDDTQKEWQRINIKVGDTKVGETQVAWNPDFIVGYSSSKKYNADEISQVEEKPMSTAHRVAYRVAATQASKLVKIALLKVLEQKADNQALSALHILFDTEFGEAIVAELLGLAINKLPNNHKLKPLAKELQISGMALAGNAIFDSLLQELIPALNNVFGELPMEESKRIKISSVENTDSLQNEGEQQDHASGSTVSPNRATL